MKRDFIKEINYLKERNAFNTYYYTTRLDEIDKALSISKRPVSLEILKKYIAISTIACIESFIRSFIKNVVDSNPKYLENIFPILDKLNIKLDSTLIINLNSKKITWGELIAHVLPCSNIQDIDANITQILGTNFFLALKEHEIIIYGEEPGEIPNEFHNNYEAIKKSIVRFFELRHILCHESGDNFILELEKVKTDFYNCQHFLNVASNYLNSLMFDRWGKTVFDETDRYYVTFLFLKTELKDEIKLARKRINKNSIDKKATRKIFNELIKNGNYYIEKKALIAKYRNRGWIHGEAEYFQLLAEGMEKFIKEVKSIENFDLNNE